MMPESTTASEATSQSVVANVNGDSEQKQSQSKEPVASTTEESTKSSPVTSATSNKVAEPEASGQGNDGEDQSTLRVSAGSASVFGQPDANRLEPTSRDIIMGPGSTGHVLNSLLHDMVRLECILWKLKKLPAPTKKSKALHDIAVKFMTVVQKGKPLELAGLKDVPRPFLRSQGRFLMRSDDGMFTIMEDQKILEAIKGLLFEELTMDSTEIPIGESPYKELNDWLERSTADAKGQDADSAIVLVPDPKDAILLRRGASNADKLYESHVGNKVVFSLISQVVTTYTTSCDARVEAALNLLHGLQDTATASNAVANLDLENDPSPDSVGAPSTPTPVSLSSSQGIGARKARFLLRNIREDESVFWSILNPAEAALFAICFVFEVYLEKEIHLQLPQQSSLVLNDTEPVLMEHSTVIPVENPLDYDVLFGRGGMTNAHPGNRRFRDVIALHRPDYIRALKMDKPGVARKIVKAIRRSGRFLKKGDDGKWYDVGDRTAAEKTSQGLRERSNAEKRQRSALREALRIRRQDMNDDAKDSEQNEADNEMSGENPAKKQKTQHDASRSNQNVSLLNYVGTQLAVPLSLGMKDVPGTSSSGRRKSSTNPISGRANSSVELFTEGLPPNAVDEEGNILVTDFDILCGRGGLTNHHKGNKRFRDIVALHRADYVRAPKIQKPSVARVIVRAIRNGDPPGRFLRKDEKTGKWVDIGDKKAAEKTSQALREKTNEERDKLRSDIVTLGSTAAGVLLPNASTFLSSTPTAVYPTTGAPPATGEENQEGIVAPAKDAPSSGIKHVPGESEDKEVKAIVEASAGTPSSNNEVGKVVEPEQAKDPVESQATNDNPAGSQVSLDDTKVDVNRVAERAEAVVEGSIPASSYVPKVEKTSKVNVEKVNEPTPSPDQASREEGASKTTVEERADRILDTFEL